MIETLQQMHVCLVLAPASFEHHPWPWNFADRSVLFSLIYSKIKIDYSSMPAHIIYIPYYSTTEKKAGLFVSAAFAHHN